MPFGPSTDERHLPSFRCSIVTPDASGIAHVEVIGVGETRALLIGATAQEMRDLGDDAGAENYLAMELQAADERGDLEGQVTALVWLSTTLSFMSRRAEGLEHARRAFALSRALPADRRVKSGLVLAGLLAGDDVEYAREAELLLGDLQRVIAEAKLDTRLEDMRLQRLEAVLRRSGQLERAAAASREVDRLRASGQGFSHARPTPAHAG